MPIEVVALDVIIVIFPISRTRVIRWVDVYGVNLASVRVRQRFQDMIVFAIYNGVILLVSTALDLASAE